MANKGGLSRSKKLPCIRYSGGIIQAGRVLFIFRISSKALTIGRKSAEL